MLMLFHQQSPVRKGITDMKKAFLRIVVFLAAVLICIPCSGKGAETRKLTLMIYMCGSNLESGSGAASLDLEEIKAAGFGSEVTVLALTGGSKGNGTSPYYPDDTVRIYQLAYGRSRCVWQSDDPMNMGDPDTLTQLLTFGQEHYPADEYALILWNHGGGPLEGVCWDELFSLDCLSLSEITEGIRAAGLERKLKWIGFDACLMSSLEVAHALSPYAEYMIASQETEPSYGWNYAFLHGIEEDETGAETGRRIVDLYFAGHEDTGDFLTLACLDLSKTEDVVRAMDLAFSETAADISETYFTRLSDVRMETTSFGKSIRAAGEAGYDLVDAVDLASRLEDSSGTFPLLEQELDGMIVYSRSNVEDVHGVSLYHPFTNKEKYLEKWGSEYIRLGFCPGYTRYIRAFAGILTGEKLVDWKNLQTEDLGSLRFGVQLTPEQAENFASAQLFILAGGFSTMGEPDHCLLVYSGPADIGRNKMVEATWPNHLLYAEKENGALVGPVSFLLTDDGRYQVVTAIYTPEGRFELDQSVNVRYYLQEQPGSPEPEIVQTRVLSEVTGTYTNRESFSEDGYGSVYLWHYYRIAPDFEVTDPLPAYADWPVDNILNKTAFRLPQAWKFRYMDGFQSGEQYFALFQITDTQQNIYCSRPVLMDNPNLTLILPEERTLMAGDMEVSLSAYRDISAIDPGLQLFVELTNCSDIPLRMKLSDLVLNEIQHLGITEDFLTVNPGETRKSRIDIREDLLIQQSAIRTVSFTVSGEDEAGRPAASAEFRFSFAVGPTLAGNGDRAVPARTEQDGVLWELLGAEPDSANNPVLTFHVVNNGPAVFDLPSGCEAEINHLLLQASLLDGPNQLRPGQEAVVRFRISNYSEMNPLYNPLKINGYDEDFTLLRLAENLLQEEGITEIQRIAILNTSNDDYMVFPPSVWGYPERSSVVLRPDSPLPLSGSAEPSGQDSLLLADNGRFSIRLERFFVGNNGAELCLRAENKTDDTMYFEIGDLKVNGLPAVSSGFREDGPICFGLNPGIAAWVSRSLVLPEFPEEETGLKEVSFSVRTGMEEEPLRVKIHVKTAVPFGIPGGIPVETDQLEAEYPEE